MKKIVTIFFASLLTVVVGCAGYQPPISLRGIDVAASDPAPKATSYVGSRPGTQPVVARTFAQQPPVIPHAVTNFDDINLTDNQCMDCHGPANFEKKKSPKLGDSHFLAGTKTFDASRYNCVQCHVPQVGAPALVENSFVGNIK